MQRAFDTWWGASCIATYVLGGWVYMSGAALVVLLIGSGRRDSKLDDRPELHRIEELTEREIDERREGC